MIAKAIEITEPSVADIQSADQAESSTVETESVSEHSLDMLAVFLVRLSVVLEATSKIEDEIRIALGLGKPQVKAWLAVAVADGCVGKFKKPVAYALSKQKWLC